MVFTISLVGDFSLIVKTISADESSYHLVPVQADAAEAGHPPQLPAAGGRGPRPGGAGSAQSRREERHGAAAGAPGDGSDDDVIIDDVMIVMMMIL